MLLFTLVASRSALFRSALASLTALMAAILQQCRIQEHRPRHVCIWIQVWVPIGIWIWICRCFLLFPSKSGRCSLLVADWNRPGFSHVRLNAVDSSSSVSQGLLRTLLLPSQLSLQTLLVPLYIAEVCDPCVEARNEKEHSTLNGPRYLMFTCRHSTSFFSVAFQDTTPYFRSSQQ